MPFLNKNTIATSLKHTRQCQVLLKLVYDEPWMVEKVTVDHQGAVWVKFIDLDMPMAMGALKGKYSMLFGERLYVQQWRITGGEPLNGYTNEYGTPLRYFGVNLRFLIHDQVGEAATVPVIPSEQRLEVLAL